MAQKVGEAVLWSMDWSFQPCVQYVEMSLEKSPNFGLDPHVLSYVSHDEQATT